MDRRRAPGQRIAFRRRYCPAMNLHDLPTPALIIDADALERNIATMAAAHRGRSLRPHVKAHKCTALATVQAAAGHRTFTCATPREVLGMAMAGLGDDLLLASEVLDARRLEAMAHAQDGAMITVAVGFRGHDRGCSPRRAAPRLDRVNVGLPRCGCSPEDAGRLADHARRLGLEVRGVMGYEGHLMMVSDRDVQSEQVRSSMDLLVAAHADVGGAIISAGGTGIHDLHDHRVDPGGQLRPDGHPLRAAGFAVRAGVLRGRHRGCPERPTLGGRMSA